MSYRLTIEEKPSYLHAKATGTHNAQNARRFLEEVHDACVRLNYSAVLLEWNLSGRSLSVSSIFDVISERIPDALTLKRIAYVDADSERNPQQMKFAETVARNRGVTVKLFRNVIDAERWIRGSTSDDSG